MFAAINSFLTRAVSGYFLNKSLRFRSSASAYLNRTASASISTYTVSMWVKRGILSSADPQYLFSHFNSGNTNSYGISFEATTDKLVYFNGTSQTTTAVYRDPAAWYHIVFSNNAGAFTMYVNGDSVKTGTATAIPSSAVMNIARNTIAGAYWFDGEMAEVNFVDGLALAPTLFGAYSTYNQWLPIKYAGTYGTNGFYLPFGSNNNNTATANYLVVAGGGGGSATFGGGYGGGGGGGAGGYRTGTLSVAAASAYTVTIGAAGLGGTTAGANGTNGGDSVFSSITSTGGGHGDSLNGTAASGGSGGGKGYGGTSTFGAGTVGQGNNGGSGTAGGSGGGGGASAVGGNGTDAGSGLFPQTGGAGGAGSSSSISGSAVTYAGGGGAGGYAGAGGGVNGGAGGSGGGGAGGGAAVAGSPGTANTGGGGGGGGGANLSTFYAGANGGSGVVIVSYTGAQIFTGGTVTTSGGNTIHTFTTSGTLTGIFNDASGNGNNWTPNNISLTAGSTYDSLTDVPTLTSTTVANYAVLNPLYYGQAGTSNTFSNGNLQNDSDRTSLNNWCATSISLPASGKWYCEVNATAASSVGVVSSNTPMQNQYPTKYRTYYGLTALKISESGNSSYGLTYTNTDTIGIAVDMDVGTITFYKNNSSQGVAFTDLISAGVTWLFGASYQGGILNTTIWNFGQQPFTYTAPSGFLPLNTYNI